MFDVRVKLCAGKGDQGTGWQRTVTNDYGAGTHAFEIYRPSYFNRFRVATGDNEAMLADLELPRNIGRPPTEHDLEKCGLSVGDQYRAITEKNGAIVDAGDVITVNFVVPQYALRVVLNEEPGDDEEDQTILELGRLMRDL